MTAPLTALEQCWICDSRRLGRVFDARLDFVQYRTQDPGLAAYSGQVIPILRCAECGFAQPSSLPSLDRFFDRMYDQRWAPEWVAHEHDADYKDHIFDAILTALERRLPVDRRRLLDVGAHAGRFIARARERRWQADGLELNPATAAFAAKASGGVVHQGNLYTWSRQGPGYDAVTLTDVLEHIPDPRSALRRVRDLLEEGGWIAVKVPNAPAQRAKEGLRATLRPGYEPTLAHNLVHVNHFDAPSLARALRREGFVEVTVEVAPPEMPEGSGTAVRLDRLTRDLVFKTARVIPAGVRTPLALNLQAYGRRS